MSNPKLTDAARLAGVSPATVSRAINQPAIVNAKTLERIQQAIQQIGYETNTAGRNLRLRRSDALLVMISDAPSRFFSQILMGVEAEASEALRIEGVKNEISQLRNQIEILETQVAFYQDKNSNRLDEIDIKLFSLMSVNDLQKIDPENTKPDQPLDNYEQAIVLIQQGKLDDALLALNI